MPAGRAAHEPAQIDELRRVLDTHEQDAAFQAGVGYYQQEGDFDFHYRIIQGSGNRRWPMLCGELYHLVRMYRYPVLRLRPIGRTRPLPNITEFSMPSLTVTVSWPSC